VIATIEVRATTPIRKDTVASLEIQGLAGVPFVLLSGGTQASPPIETRRGQRLPVIASMPSRIERVLMDAPAAVQRLNLLIARANELLSVENRAAISDTLNNLSTVSDAVAARSTDIETLIRDASLTMANLRDATAAFEKVAARAESTLAAFEGAARSIDRTAARTGDELGPLLADLRGSAKSITAMADEIEAMVAENREPVNEFSTTASVEILTFLTEARQLVLGLNRVAAQVERDPGRFLFGDQTQGYEATGNK
jgi:hypothetical protein